MEESESGAPIYRHEDKDREFELAMGDSENIERISDHIERHIGPIDNIFHELISDLVHIDVHVVAPTETRPFYTLVTSGMSDKPMNAPKGLEDLRFAELMICLPPDWPMSQEAWKQHEDAYWPIYSLKFLARFPHEYQTWLWATHTVPNGDPPAPFAKNTELCCAMLMPPLTGGDQFNELRIDDHKTIHFFGIIPITRDEMEFKLKHGAEALIDGFERNQVSEILDPGRPSSLKKKSWWRR